MIAYLNIVRWKNILLLLLIQWLMIFTVVFPIFQTFGFDTSEYHLQIMLLVSATLLITAGGYVINDYFDVKIDRINKPDKVIVTNQITQKNAMCYYQSLTAMGVLTGLVLAVWVKSFTIGLIFVITPGMLWFYSASYKRQFLIGNVIVSLSSALSVLIVGVFGIAILKLEYQELLFETPIPTLLYAWIGGFAIFAFLITCVREIIKDAEDIEGDRELESRTLPIKLGIKKTKIALVILITTILSTLFFVQFKLIPFNDSLSLKYIGIAIIVPLIILLVLVVKSRTKADWHTASTWSKLIMLSGVLYSLIFYYLQAKKYGISLFNLFIING